jgi:hypothetical protein
MNDPNFDLSHGLPSAPVPRDGLQRLKHRAVKRARVRRSFGVVAVVGVSAIISILSTSLGDDSPDLAQNLTSTTIPMTSTTLSITTTTPASGNTSTTAKTIPDWVGLQFTEVPKGLNEVGWVDAELRDGTPMRISEVSDSDRSYFWSSRQIGTVNGNQKWQVVSSVPLAGVTPPGCIGTCKKTDGTAGSTTVVIFESVYTDSSAKAAWTMNPKSGVLEPTDPSVWTRM